MKIPGFMKSKPKDIDYSQFENFRSFDEYKQAIESADSLRRQCIDNREYHHTGVIQDGPVNHTENEAVMKEADVLLSCQNFRTVDAAMTMFTSDVDMSVSDVKNACDCLDKMYHDSTKHGEYGQWETMSDEQFQNAVHDFVDMARDGIDLSNKAKLIAGTSDYVNQNFGNFGDHMRAYLSNPENNGVSLDEVLKKGEGVGSAAYMGAKSSYHFSNGEDQLDFVGKVIEPSHEVFVGAESIYLNGNLLYDRDVMSVDNYHNESYTRGTFDSAKNAIDYLKSRYGDEPWYPLERSHRTEPYNAPYRWDNPAYAKEMEARENGTYLDRIVFRDNGIFTNKVGQKYHAVDFAYACDQKTADDKPMGNPYLMSTKRKDASGKSKTSHTYYLSDEIYGRLMDMSNKSGCENTKWSGVIDARVVYPTQRDGKSKVSVDLTRAAAARGDIEIPSEPFNEAKHDSFIKSSLRTIHKQREQAAMERSAGIEASVLDLSDEKSV